MESKKQRKEENNALLKTLEGRSLTQSVDEAPFTEFESQFNFSPQTEAVLKANVSEQALENIKHIFNKTQTIREVANVKHDEIQSQFKELRERLNKSSECLQRMKKGIDNIKFTYQTKIFEMQRCLAHPDDHPELVNTPPQTREEMTKQMEGIRDKIEKIQGHIYQEKDKQQAVMKSYQDAFDNVTAVLKSIDCGDYSSFSSSNVKKAQ